MLRPPRSTTLLLSATACATLAVGCSSGGESKEIVENPTAPNVAVPDAAPPPPTAAPSPLDAGQAPDAGFSERLCDGSQALRLAVKNVPAPGLAEVQLAFDLGFKSTYVRGDCRYWVQETHQDTETIRTGVLTEEMAREFARDMRYSELARFDDLDEGNLTLDTYIVFSDGDKSVWCRGGCFEGELEVPAELIEMATLYASWRERLLALSEDMTGPMRVILHKDTLHPDVVPDYGDCDLTWPFSFDPEPLAGEGDRSLLPSFRIDGPEAQELRDWWRGNLNAPNPCYAGNSGGDFYVGGDRPAQYRLWMRDSLPFENEDGLIPLPPPAGL